jgi:hypothetical protein
MRQALGLYRLGWVQGVRRLYYSFATELVIGFSAGILIALFYYLFSDFLNTQVAAISPTLQRSLGSGLSLIILTLVAIHVGILLARQQSSPNLLPRVVARLGENPQTLRGYYLLQIPSLIAGYYLPSFSLVLLGFAQWQLREVTAVLIGMLLLSGFTYWRTVTKGALQGTQLRTQHTRPLLGEASKPALFTLMLWRLKQMIFRIKSTRILLSCALLLALGNGLWSTQGVPPLLTLVLAYFTGLLSAAALILCIAEDCRSLWIERNCGVSHELYLRALQLLAGCIGSATALLSAAALSYPLFVAYPSLSGEVVAKAALVSFACPFLVPYLALQIDGKRSGVQIITAVLVSLLLVTAIFAHILSVLLLPLIASYGLKAQRGRFYNL